MKQPSKRHALAIAAYCPEIPDIMKKNFLPDSNKNEIITILVCMFTHGYPDAPLNSSNRQFPLLFSSLCPIAPVKIAVAYGFGYMVALDMFTGFQVGNGTGNL